MGSRTLLLIGDGVFADSLAKTLAGQGVDVERANIASAGTTADVLLPDMIVLAADAAQSRGVAVLSQLQAASRTTPTLVISAAEAGGLVPVQAPAHVAYITPAGGVIDCAGRVRALLVGLNEHQSSGASLQKLADKVASRAGRPGTSKAAPAQTSPGFPSPLSAAGSKTSAGATAAKSPVQPGASSAKASNDTTPKAAQQPNKSGAAIQPEAAAGGSATDQTAQRNAAQINQPAEANKAGPAQTAAIQPKLQQPNSASAIKPTTNASSLHEVGAATQHKRQQLNKPQAEAAPNPSSATQEVTERKPQQAPKSARVREADTRAATPNPTREGAQHKPLQSSKPSEASKAKAASTAASASREDAQNKPPAGATTAGQATHEAARKVPLTDKPSEAASALRKTAGAARVIEAKDKTAAVIDAQPSAAAPPLMTPSAAPSAIATRPHEATATGRGVAPSKQPSRSAASSAGSAPSTGARPQIDRPPTLQPTAALSAAPQARAAITGQVAAKPPTITTTGSLPRAMSGQPPAAISGMPQARSAQAAFTTSPAPPRAAEQPTLRPTAPGPEEPVLQAAQTVRPASSQEQPQKPANDQGAPPEAEKTAPRIPLRAGKRAATNAGDAAGAAKAALREPPASAHGAPAAPELHEAIRASELDIAISMSDPPPARVEPSQQQQERKPQETAPQTLHAQRKDATAAAARTPAQRLSDLDVRQVSDSEVDIVLSDRPASLTPKLLPADTNPPPANQNTGAATGPTPRTNEAVTHSAGTVLRSHDAAARSTGNFAQAAPAHAARNPLDPAPRTHDAAARSTGNFGQSMPARAPRYPFEPAPRAAEPAISPNVAHLPSGAPRHPFDPAPRPKDPAHTTASVPRMPSGAPRHPFDPAPRAAELATSASIPSMPSGAPRAQSGDPERARGRKATPSAIKRNPAIRTGRAPADPFQPAAAPERDAPLGMPDLALTPNAETAPRPRRGRAAWVLGAVAAIGCSASWLYLTYDRSAATAPGNAATGALVQTPPLKPLPVEHAAPPALTPEPTATAPEAPEPSAPSTSSERRTGGARRAGDANEADPTTAVGRARGLVDSGSAMLRQGRYGLAEGMYMKALQEVPEYPPAMAELVRVHLARKDGKEAVRWAELLVAKQSNGVHQLLLGDAQALRGNHSAAEAAWSKAAQAGNATAKQRLSDDDEEEE